MNALVRRLLLALTSCPFASFMRKPCRHKDLQVSVSTMNSGIRLPPLPPSNRDFQTSDSRGPPGVGAESPVFPPAISLLRANYLPVMRELSPCYGPAPRPGPILTNILLSDGFLSRNPIRRPPILPVFCLLSGSIRENRGAKPLSSPSLTRPTLPSPSKLGVSPGDLRCVNAVARRVFLTS